MMTMTIMLASMIVSQNLLLNDDYDVDVDDDDNDDDGHDDDDEKKYLIHLQRDNTDLLLAINFNLVSSPSALIRYKNPVELSA